VGALLSSPNKIFGEGIMKTNLFKLAILSSVVLSASAFAAGGDASTGVKADVNTPAMSINSDTKADVGTKTHKATHSGKKSATKAHHKASKASVNSESRADAKADAEATDKVLDEEAKKIQ
jgi:hypothetical protein